jgi:hypothetical protein
LATKQAQRSTPAVHSPHQNPSPQRLNFEKTGLKFTEETDPDSGDDSGLKKNPHRLGLCGF